MWDVETGAHAATLSGHGGYVTALAVHGDRIFSASDDGAIWVWGSAAWEALRTVQVFERGTGQYPECLAVSGSHLISGSWNFGEQGEVRVWNLETLELLHTLRRVQQPVAMGVRALLAVNCAVWAGVGRDVVVWGHRAVAR